MREISKLYLANFLQGFATIASVTFTLYFLSHGLSQYQISILFSVFMISMALFQIPTGGFADTYGHKNSITIGLLVHALSFEVFAFVPNFYGFLFGMVLGALGLAFQTGAYSSLVHELLTKLDHPHDFEKVIGRGYAFFEIAAIVASLSGPFIYKIYAPATQLIAGLFIFLSGLTIYSIPWEFTKESRTVKHFFLKMQTGVTLTLVNPKLLAIVIIGIALTVSRMVLNQNISQPYLINLQLPIEFLGVVTALLAIIGALIYGFAHTISKAIRPLTALLLVIFIPSLSCLFLSFNQTPFWGVFFLIFFFTGHAYRDVFFTRITNDLVTSAQRSTMISTMTFLTSIIVGLLLPLWGKIIDMSNLQFTLLLIFIFTSLIGLIGVYVFTHPFTFPKK